MMYSLNDAIEQIDSIANNMLKGADYCSSIVTIGRLRDVAANLKNIKHSYTGMSEIRDDEKIIIHDPSKGLLVCRKMYGWEIDEMIEKSQQECDCDE